MNRTIVVRSSRSVILTFSNGFGKNRLSRGKTLDGKASTRSSRSIARISAGRISSENPRPLEIQPPIRPVDGSTNRYLATVSPLVRGLQMYSIRPPPTAIVAREKQACYSFIFCLEKGTRSPWLIPVFLARLHGFSDKILSYYLSCYFFHSWMGLSGMKRWGELVRFRTHDSIERLKKRLKFNYSERNVITKNFVEWPPTFSPTNF